VPLADVLVDDELRATVDEVVDSGWWSMGPKVAEFEAAFAEFCGTTHALAVANGTAALHLALLAVGCGPGDEVILPSLNFVAAANAIGHTGATPVFCDIVGPDDLNLDTADLEAAVTSATKAVLLLHYGGFPCDIAPVRALAEDLASHGYVVVAIDHPYDAGIVEFPDGHVVIPNSQLDITKALKVRVADTRFILNELAQLGRSGAFAGRLDLRRVGMFGHSLGGAAAASAMLVDSRIRAGVDLDGLLFDPVRTSGLSRPFLLMNAEPGFAAQPSVAGFWNRLRGPHYAVDVKGAQHFAFSDLVFFVPELLRTNPTAASSLRQLIGNVEGVATLAAERAYIHAFFERFLRANPQSLLTQTPGPFAGVRLTIGGKP
jgi:predicted alpha/beta-hydrolase family hydrolase